MNRIWWWKAGVGLATGYVCAPSHLLMTYPCVCVCVCVCACSHVSCSVVSNPLHLCNPMNCSQSSSITSQSVTEEAIHGILQARTREWVAISFFRGSSQPRHQTQVSCIAGGIFTIWATREAPLAQSNPVYPRFVLYLGPFIPFPIEGRFHIYRSL